MSDHTPWRYEPHVTGVSWLVGPDAKLGPIGPQGEDLTGIHVAAIVKDSEDRARRVAALWNACSGIPTEALEAGVVERMRIALFGCAEHMEWSTKFGKAAYEQSRAILKELK